MPDCGKHWLRLLTRLYAMSLARLALPMLSWAEFAEILGWMSLREVWLLGCCNSSAFVTFLREKSFREGCKLRPLAFRYPRFLFKTSPHDKAALVSYPRSGNSFMRKVLEQETGIVTGSDSRPNRTLAASLLKFGYLGEGITDQSVWIVKSHFPERLGYVAFPVNRVILLVRNPFDAIQSYFHMGMTNTHDKNLSAAAFAGLTTLWQEFIVNEAKVWFEFHRYWLERSDQLNMVVLRYEDLLEDGQETVAKALIFLRQGCCPLGLDRYLRRHDHAPAAAPGYKTRNKTVGKSLGAMTLRDALAVAGITHQFMDAFGYKLKERDNVDGDGLDGPASNAMELEVIPMLLAGTAFASSTTGQAPSSITINQGTVVRSAEDKFGRKITDVRKALTCNDRKPFHVS